MRSWIPRLRHARPAESPAYDRYAWIRQEEARHVPRTAQYVAELAGTHTAGGKLA
jgi:hypothetical protein